MRTIFITVVILGVVASSVHGEQKTSRSESKPKVEKDKKIAATLPNHLDPSEWALVWEDEFLGNTIDSKKWKHCPEGHRGGKAGLASWSNQEAFLDSKGNLVLQISKKDGKLFSGAVRTKCLFEKKYGYFEIRCKVPVIKSGWCAFWMMPFKGDLVKGDEGRDGTEIDIFESIWAEKGQVQQALYWGGYTDEDLQGRTHVMYNNADLYHGYHTYAVQWTEEEYVFYIDNKCVWRTHAGGVMRVPAYMKISIEAATWAGNETEKNLPKKMLVDYVRVYEKTCK